MKTLKYILFGFSLIYFGLSNFAQDLNSVVCSESIPTFVNKTTLADFSALQSSDFEFSIDQDHSHHNSIHVVFGENTNVTTLFSSDVIDPLATALSASGSIDIAFKAEILNTSNTILNEETFTLELIYVEGSVNSPGKYQFVDYFTFKNLNLSTGDYKLRLTETLYNVPGGSSNVFNSEDLALRVFKSYESYTDSPTLSSSTLTIANTGSNLETIKFTLPNITEGREIDLEWINVERPLHDITTSFINQYKENDDVLDMSVDNLPNTNYSENGFHEATRVTITEQQSSSNIYTIPHLFKEGYLLARCRAVDYLPNGKRIEGNWVVSNGLALNTTFQEDNVWQSSSSYIENAKHKDVVSYSDGSQRTRQVVTKLASEDIAVVGETFYDYQGRPSITPLASPDLSGNNTHSLRSQFNRFAGNTKITPSNFDHRNLSGLTNNLDNQTSLDDSEGTEKYYSSNNSVEANIPDANGFAYSKVLYMNDGTDRPKAVSSVGNQFTLNSGRATEYFYGVPMQPELDRLFGNNAGDATKYKKNFVQDANNQLSTSYINLNGQVVATALSHTSPSSVFPIEGSEHVQTIEVNLLKGTTIDKELQEITGYSMAYSQTFTASTPGPYDFQYELKGLASEALSANWSYCTTPIGDVYPFGQEHYTNEPNIKTTQFDAYVPDKVLNEKNDVLPSQSVINLGCTDCKYNVYMGLIDPDGFVQKCYLGESQNGSTDNEAILFNKTSSQINTSLENFWANLSDLGTYTLVKIISVDETEANFKHRINRILLNLTPEVELDWPEVYSEDCYGYMKYMVRKQDTDGDGVPDTRFKTDGTVLLESELVDYIENECSDPDDGINYPNECDGHLASLLADISPGGQFFDNTPDQSVYDNGDLVENPDYDKDAWLNEGMYSTHRALPFSRYVNSEGDVNNVGLLNYFKNDVFEGTPAFSSDSWYFEMNSWDDLRENWKEEYAYILLPLHPEFMTLLYNCNESVINAYDDILPVFQAHNINSSGFLLPEDVTMDDLSAYGPVSLQKSTEVVNTSNNFLPDHYPNKFYIQKYKATIHQQTAIDLGYFNPLGLSGVPASLDATGGNSLDPYFTTFSGSNLWIKDKVIERLNNFLPTNLSGTSYLSIYDVLDYDFDPASVSSYFTGGVPSSISEINYAISQCTSGCEELLMASYHYPGFGIFATGQVSKWDYFKNIYTAYRDFAIYTRYKAFNGQTKDVAVSWGGTLWDTDGLDYPAYYLPKKTFDQFSGVFDLVGNCNAQGTYPAYVLDEETGPNSGAGCMTYLINYTVLNMDGTVSYYDNHSFLPAVSLQTDYGFIHKNEVGVDPIIELKRNDGFAFTYPRNEFYELIATTNDANEIKTKLEEIFASEYSDIDQNWMQACESKKEVLANFLLIDDEIGGNVIPSTLLKSTIENGMYNFCYDKKSTYYTNSQFNADMVSYIGLSSYSVSAPSAYELFSSNSGPELEKYTLHSDRISDIECAASTLKTDYIARGSSVDQLVSDYLDNDLIDLPNNEIAAFKTHLTTKWLVGSNAICNKNNLKPEDLYNVIHHTTTSPTYQPGVTFNVPFSQFVGGIQMHKAFAFLQCSTYEEGDPQITLIKQVNADIKKKALASFFKKQDEKHIPYKENYLKKCLQINERLRIKYQLNEYQYTLFYYDAAGNLIKTVPPKGVDILDGSELANVEAFRNGTSLDDEYPEHTYVTTYKYNSLNQIEFQSTPDGGETEFWYDELGRVIISRNAQQKLDNKFSYSLYDKLGRIKESGEAYHTSFPTAAQRSTVYSGNSNPFISWLYPSGFNPTPSKYDVVRTYYDEKADNTIQSYFDNGGQQNLRGRISYILKYDYLNHTYAQQPNTVPKHKYSSYYYYSYDIHGNVKQLVQELKHHAFGSDIKSTKYMYDLISGNVLKVIYQEGEKDQFFHKYTYDEDNRIQEVYTSNDGYVWREDANYDYYMHGPLKRTEIGNAQVQGLDYAYTLQGWLKGVNSNQVGMTDMGNDGSGTGVNAGFGKDEFAYALNYFDNDYSNANSKFVDQTMLHGTKHNLYNGNIAQMYTGIFQDNAKHVLNNYRYDQLQRIKATRSEIGSESGTSVNYATFFQENYYDYDKNGNFKEVYRGDNTGAYDLLDYTYENNTNQLAHVEDNPDNDLPESYIGSGDFEYDEIGNLIKDSNSEIIKITWTHSGKVKTIQYDPSSSRNDLEFVYDALGNRVLKIEKIGSALTWKYNYYAYDASGNPMANYTWTADNSAELALQKKLNGHNIYGADRLGTSSRLVSENSDALFDLGNIYFSGNSTVTGWAALMESEPEIDFGNISVSVLKQVSPTNKHIKFATGSKLELSLNSVPRDAMPLFAFEPMEIDQKFASSVKTKDLFLPVNANGFYEVPANTLFELTPTGTNLEFNAGGSGLTEFAFVDVWLDASSFSNIKTFKSFPTLKITYVDYLGGQGETSFKSALAVGLKSFELKNHLGNVLAVVSDGKESDTKSFVSSYSDYLPFGMQMPGRKFDTDGYRYGFQGQEKDDEVKGEGNSVNYKYRMHDPRLGRFFAVDPLTMGYPQWSPYAFSGNQVIHTVELEGLEPGKDLCYNLSPDILITRDNSVGIGTEADKKMHAAFERGKGIGLGLGAGAVGFTFVAVETAPMLMLVATNPEALNEATGLVWGVFTDEEYPAPWVVTDNLVRAGRHIDELVGPKQLEQTSDVVEQVAGSIRNVNKNIDGDVLGSMNCTNCVISVDLALMGIKSSALPKALDPLTGKYVDGGVTIGFLADYFGSKWGKTSYSALRKLKEGKRGVIYGTSKNSGGGHVFNVVNQNGTVRYLDGQTGKAANIEDWTDLQFLPTN